MQTKPVLAFDDAFITGVDEIDDQHRNLINLTNEAAQVFAAGPPANQVHQLVQELLSYAIYHFRTEETLMQQYGYREASNEAAESHIQQHRDFAAKVVSVQEALQRRQFVDPDALVAYLAEWITRHILGTDQDLAAFILERRAEQGDRPGAIRVSPDG